MRDLKPLTEQEIKDKIFQAEKDIERLKSDSYSKQAEVLEQYIEYLKDDLKQLEKNGNN
jgi:phosphomannomutase